MTQIFVVAIGGAAGALCRWGTGKLAAQLWGSGFPYGTLIVNVAGCFLMGLIMHIGLATDRIGQTTRLALTVGFLGAMTTFSSFSYETICLLEEGNWTGAAANAAANVALGLIATITGIGLGRILFGGTA